MTEIREIEKRENGVAFYQLKSKDVQIVVTNLGCHICSIFMKDRYGNIDDVVLGYEDIEDCHKDGSYMGAIVGRVANRIEGTKFELNGKSYYLAMNDGTNHLHGGIVGFDQKIFETDIIEDGICFGYLSPDMEEGYPGNLYLQVTYRLMKNNLFIEYEASSDQDTIVNITNHTYFNLTGCKEKIYKHQLKMAADTIACIDENFVNCGRFINVKNSPFDFTNFHEIGERINEDHEQLKLEAGYNHSFILKEQENQAVLYEPKSGRKVSITTTLPTIHVYSGDYLEGGVNGKQGVPYENRDGVALEAQYLANSIHIEKNPRVILRKQEQRKEITIYRFDVE